MGHGVRAALVTAMMRALEEQLGEEAADPGRLLTEINRALRGIFGHTSSGLFATACFLVVDVATSRMRFANAGHPSPLLVRPAVGGVAPILPPVATSPALGLFDQAEYHTYERPVAAADLLLFFTDGLFEVENAQDETFSEGRLRESVRQRAGLPPAQLLNDVFADVQRFAEGRDFVDDVCLVGMEIAHLDPSAA
jgi:serine phosphatase RsbU (regulator of sigma subunit)